LPSHHHIGCHWDVAYYTSLVLPIKHVVNDVVDKAGILYACRRSIIYVLAHWATGFQNVFPALDMSDHNSLRG